MKTQRRSRYFLYSSGIHRTFLFPDHKSITNSKYEENRIKRVWTLEIIKLYDYRTAVGPAVFFVTIYGTQAL